jgi:hypothetical protein
MAVENDGKTPKQSSPREPDTPPPPPQTYRVARSASGNDVLNTIDLFGEKPFSV